MLLKSNHVSILINPYKADNKTFNFDNGIVPDPEFIKSTTAKNKTIITYLR